MKALLIAIACVAAAVGGLAACGGSGDGAAQALPLATPTAIAAAQGQPTSTATAATTAQSQPTSTAVAAAAQTPPTTTVTAAAVATATAPPSATPESLRAPEFSLPAARGGTVSLSGLLDGKDGAALVFYRGFF